MAELAYSFVERTETFYEHIICVWAFTTSHSWKRLFFFHSKKKFFFLKDVLLLFSLVIEIPRDDVFRKYVSNHSKYLCIILQRQEIALKIIKSSVSISLGFSSLNLGCTLESHGKFKKITIILISGFPSQKVWLYRSGCVLGISSFKSSPGDCNVQEHLRTTDLA